MGPEACVSFATFSLRYSLAMVRAHLAVGIAFGPVNARCESRDGGSRGGVVPFNAIYSLWRRMLFVDHFLITNGFYGLKPGRNGYRQSMNSIGKTDSTIPKLLQKYR
jgi:hypothetical protein